MAGTDDSTEKMKRIAVAFALNLVVIYVATIPGMGVVSMMGGQPPGLIDWAILQALMWPPYVLAAAAVTAVNELDWRQGIGGVVRG